VVNILGDYPIPFERGRAVELEVPRMGFEGRIRNKI
jgi:hypothetical protein